MLGTYPNARALAWPGLLPRHRAYRAIRTRTRPHQALRHGVLGAVKACSMSAALMAASAVVGASRGPVVLSEPSQPLVAHLAAAPAPAAIPSVRLAAKVTTR